MSTSDERTPLIKSDTSRQSKKSKILISSFVFFGLFGIIVYSLSTIRKFSNFNRQLPELFGPLKVRIYTNNIRFDNHYTDPYEEPWSTRKHSVISSISFNTQSGDANIVCLQEVLHNQLNDILLGLNNNGASNEWTYYGVGRSDGKTKGEYSPILFKRSEWILLDNKTFWLSESPDIPSRGWDAALERIVTMVTLQSKTNPLIKLNFFNTHFDHRGKIARRESSMLIVDKMKYHNSYPSFLCGDFNTQPTDEPYHILTAAGFKDSRLLIDKPHRYGHSSTFTGFDKNNEAHAIIDYIWSPYFSENGNNLEPTIQQPLTNYYNLRLQDDYRIEIKNFGILHSFFHGYHFSDHRPVSSDYYVYRSLF